MALLELNTELYPASANTYDSYGEVLIAAGQIDKAIAVTEEMLRRVDADPAPNKDALRRGAEKRLKKLRAAR